MPLPSATKIKQGGADAGAVDGAECPRFFFSFGLWLLEFSFGPLTVPVPPNIAGATILKQRAQGHFVLNNVDDASKRLTDKFFNLVFDELEHPVEVIKPPF